MDLANRWVRFKSHVVSHPDLTKAPIDLHSNNDSPQEGLSILTLNGATTPSGTDWRGRFGAADRNTVGHCWRMVEALRIDPAFSGPATGTRKPGGKRIMLGGIGRTIPLTQTGGMPS
jgi:hypothetical protein